jgi:hypothetical protein
MRIILKPHETMKRRRAQERLYRDANLVHEAIRSNPGVAGKGKISTLTGLSPDRVAEVIKRINAEETGHTRLEYGEAKATGGPNAGKVVRGWFVMNRKAHHIAMDQADDHGARIEVGIRRSRLVRLLQAQGIRGADAVVESIEERLGLSVEAMSQADLEAFRELLTEDVADSEGTAA